MTFISVSLCDYSVYLCVTKKELSQSVTEKHGVTQRIIILSCTYVYFKLSGFQSNPHLTELLISSIIVISKKAILKFWGKRAWIRRKPAEMKKTILNHIMPSFFRMSITRHSIMNGLSHKMFRFHFICAWSVKKLKKIINTERSEKTE